MSRGVVHAAAAATSGGGARRWRLARIILTGKALGRRAGLMWSSRIGCWSPGTAAAAWVFPFTAR
jgi:hypothetical protein